MACFLQEMKNSFWIVGQVLRFYSANFEDKGIIEVPLADLFDILGEDFTLEVAQSSAKGRLIGKDGHFQRTIIA